ncbi:hypothetical protein A7X61_03285 [Stenotrophomonas maltophilia]|nr:hypothetical protein A7X61_03285 [Stenotrophomonas maltophilia]
MPALGCNGRDVKSIGLSCIGGLDVFNGLSSAQIDLLQSAVNSSQRVSNDDGTDAIILVGKVQQPLVEAGYVCVQLLIGDVFCEGNRPCYLRQEKKILYL